MSSIIKLDHVPDGLDEIYEYYGDPDAPDFFEKNLRRFNVPFPLRLSWEPDVQVTRILAHKRVGDAIVDALFEIAEYKGADYVHAEGLDYYGGTFANRKKRGIDEPSTHAWAIAIDLNPHRGPLGEQPAMPQFIVDAFERRGFVWGGHFQRPDGMHFQACRGY
jgi:hypothetical protein